MAKARIPADRQAALAEPEIAIEEIDRVRTAGVRIGCVLADAGYDMSAPFRQGLSKRGLSWAVGIPARQKTHAADVAMIFPVAGHGRPRQHHNPQQQVRRCRSAAGGQPWRRFSWRCGTKERLTARAAWRVRVADGPIQRIRDMGNQHLPGEQGSLIGEHRSTGERSYYPSHLPPDMPLRTLAGAFKARWICEQAHR